MSLTLDYTFRRWPKLSGYRADIKLVDTYREYSIRILHIVAVIALFGALALAQDAPKKITRAEALSALVSKVQPEYPAIARQLKMQGEVDLNAVVTEEGKVAKVEVVSGNPVLTGPAAQAVKLWKFKPFQENGKPIRVIAPIVLEFKL